MALTGSVTLNTTSFVAGATPPPLATLTVYNPNAVPVAVTGVRLVYGTNPANNGNEVPIGPGQTSVVPAGGSITIGPMAISIGSAANVNSFQAVNQTGNLSPVNPQPSQPPQSLVSVGATFYGSDGSVNVAGAAGALVSYSMPPPLGYQGGFLQLSGPNNLATAFLAGLF
jgi:hypothetical protein